MRIPSSGNNFDLLIVRTSRNSGLYVASRTLFVMAQKSELQIIRQTIGRTNHGHTPLAAIFVSFVPGFVAFLAIKAPSQTYQEVYCNLYPHRGVADRMGQPIARMGRLYVGPLLCIYVSQCIAYIRFKQG